MNLKRTLFFHLHFVPHVVQTNAVCKLKFFKILLDDHSVTRLSILTHNIVFLSDSGPVGQIHSTRGVLDIFYFYIRLFIIYTSTES